MIHVYLFVCVSLSSHFLLPVSLALIVLVDHISKAKKRKKRANESDRQGQRDASIDRRRKRTENHVCSFSVVFHSAVCLSSVCHIYCVVWLYYSSVFLLILRWVRVIIWHKTHYLSMYSCSAHTPYTQIKHTRSASYEELGGKKKNPKETHTMTLLDTIFRSFSYTLTPAVDLFLCPL